MLIATLRCTLKCLQAERYCRTVVIISFASLKDKALQLNQSVRAIEIFNFMYTVFDGLDVNREDYDKLRKRLETRNKTKLQETRVKIHSL